MRYRIETIKSVEEVSEASWNRLVADGSPFMDWGFLAALERSKCLDPASGWYPCIVLVKEDSTGELLGAAPLYLKTHSQGEFVFDWSWADAAQRMGINYYPKGVVAAPFSPVTGVRLLVDSSLENSDSMRRLLIQGCLEVARELKLSSLHFNFILPSEVSLFEDENLLIRHGIQYHWKNKGYEGFDDFLAELKSKKRANIRRERRLLAESGVQVRVITGKQITPEVMKKMYRFYRATVHKFYWGSQYLTADFFKEILRTAPELLHLTVAEQGGEIFAGAFNLYKGERLYGRYWGCEKEVEFAHFEVCMYRNIEWSIANGIQVFEPGAGGEHKRDRGFEATPTYSAHWIAEPQLAGAIARFLEHERDVVEQNIELLDAQGPFKSC